MLGLYSQYKNLWCIHVIYMFVWLYLHVILDGCFVYKGFIRWVFCPDSDLASGFGHEYREDSQ